MGEFDCNINKLVKPVYVSSAVNSTPNCLDWGSNGLVIYGSCNAIHLYDPRIIVSYSLKTNIHLLAFNFNPTYFFCTLMFLN